MTALPPSASGEWGGGWSAARSRSRERWRAGWDRDADQCPADPKDRTCPDPQGWRELGGIGGDEWRDLHWNRTKVVRALRRAGYVARHRWGRTLDGQRKAGKTLVDKWTYTEGPAVGREAVDPWKLARALSGCSRTWVTQARITSGAELRVVALPRRCSRNHLCPVCAGAAARALGGAMRLVIADQVRTGAIAQGDKLFLLTPTQRDQEGRSLYLELERLRDGWRRMTTGRPGREWKRRVKGSFYGVEVTRGAAGKDGALGLWWHVHMHVVVHVSAEFVDTFREWVADRWESASAGAAELHEVPAGGWSRAAGGSEWCKEIDPMEPKEVYQACKYPTPAVELHPVNLAEFVSVAHGRRWHDGRGSFRGVSKRAEDLEADSTAPPEDPDAYDVGEGVVGLGPDAPPLDCVDPEIGRESPCGMVLPDASDLVTWTLRSGVDLVSVAAAVRRVGGRITGPETCPDSRQLSIAVPIGVCRALLHEWHSAITSRKALRQRQSEAGEA